MNDRDLRALERAAACGDAAAQTALQRARERSAQPYAVLACVHANLEALEAVFADLDAQGVHEAICLGDLVGYGPDPIACVDLIRSRCQFVLKGNHDEATVLGAQAFSLNAGRVVRWTAARMRPRLLSRSRKRQRWAFLQNLPETYRRGPDLFVHGSPRNPTIEYVLETDLHPAGRAKIEEIFTTFSRLLFVGHSHLPGLIRDDFTFTPPEALPESTYVHSRGRAIVNVGSVGQPRDRDPRACYVIVAADRITWRRVPYDFERTIQKLAATRSLRDMTVLQERLRQGL